MGDSEFFVYSVDAINERRDADLGRVGQALSLKVLYLGAPTMGPYYMGTQYLTVNSAHQYNCIKSHGSEPS